MLVPGAAALVLACAPATTTTTLKTPVHLTRGSPTSQFRSENNIKTLYHFFFSIILCFVQLASFALLPFNKIAPFIYFPAALNNFTSPTVLFHVTKQKG